MLDKPSTLAVENVDIFQTNNLCRLKSRQDPNFETHQ